MKCHCGAYAIVCTETGQRYIGGSKEIERRWYFHRSRLIAGAHHCQALQALHTAGYRLLFVVVEECQPAELRQAEERHSDATPRHLLLNAVIGFRVRHSEETKRKMAEAALRVAADPAERERRSQRARQQHAAGKFGRATWRATR